MTVPAIKPDVKPMKSKPRKAAEKREQGNKRGAFHEVENVWYIAQFAQLLAKHDIDKKALQGALTKKDMTKAVLAKVRQNDPIRRKQAETIVKELNKLIQDKDENAETLDPKKVLVPGHYKIVGLIELLDETKGMTVAGLSAICALSTAVLESVAMGRRIPQATALTIIQGINLARAGHGLPLVDPTQAILKESEPKVLAVKGALPTTEEFSEWPPSLTAEDLQAKPIVGNKWYPKSPKEMAS
ncbi:MAG: hypothetical protein ACFCD0_18745 [Gemmataceae bacterium]